MYWILVLSFFLYKSNAQLTSPGETVCVGEQVVFACQQPGSTSRWGLTLSEVRISRSVSSSQVGTVLSFINDPGFGFEIHVLPSSSASSVISELRVTAVQQLNGTTVECVGPTLYLTSTIQIAAIDPPAAPSGVITTTDQSQFTPSTATITLNWSASSGADNYTITVTPLLPSGQSLVSTTTTSLQLTVLYNEEYSINLTAQNCAGSNSTIVPLTVAGCSPPSPPANGSISEYSSGAIGAMLTFQCDTGYMPQEEVTSTCMSNNSWVPVPKCEVVDCNALFGVIEVIIEPFDDTKFGALITFHCEESNNSITAVCGSNGEWDPDPASLKCGNDCSTPFGPPRVIIEPFNDTKLGALITFHCEESDTLITAVCGRNGEWDPDPASLMCEIKLPDCNAPFGATGVIIEPFNDTKLGALISFRCENPMTSVCGSDGDLEWIPNPASLKCGDGSSGSGSTLSTGSQVTITAIVCSLGFLLFGMFLGALLHYCIMRYTGKFKLTSSNPTPPPASAPVIYEEVSLADSHTERKMVDIELDENVAYGPITK